MRQRQRQQLAAFIQQKRATDDRGARRTPLELGARGPTGQVFSPAKHGLSWAQCQMAEALLTRANARRPLTGTPAQIQFRRACRIGGILSTVRSGLVQNSRWGRSMLATKGGNALALHALGHLRQWAPVARLAAMMARERKQAAQYYEEHGEVLPLGASPTETPEQARVRSLQTAWEEQCQTQQLEQRLRW